MPSWADAERSVSSKRKSFPRRFFLLFLRVFFGLGLGSCCHSRHGGLLFFLPHFYFFDFNFTSSFSEAFALFDGSSLFFWLVLWFIVFVFYHDGVFVCLFYRIRYIWVIGGKGFFGFNFSLRDREWELGFSGKVEDHVA